MKMTFDDINLHEMNRIDIPWGGVLGAGFFFCARAFW